MDADFSKKVLQNFLDMFVIPEIRRRQEEDSAPRPFPLQMAQILFYSDGKKPEVRLNTEVKALALFAMNEGCVTEFSVGDSPAWGQLEGIARRIERICLTEADEDCGHATLIFLNGTWNVSFDFIYNKRLSRNHLRVASEFLASAENARNNEHWSVFVDSLCSASELVAKAYLLGRPDKIIRTSKKHSIVSSRINQERQLGNVADSHVDSLNKLWQLRRSARYLEGELHINSAIADQIYADIVDFFEDVKGRSASRIDLPK